MNIGFITTWFERGAAYVTKQYADLLEKKGHNVFIYARGEHFAIGNPKWDRSNVTWGKKLYDTVLDCNHVEKWIKKNRIECVFFNEQRDIKSVIQLKILIPNLKIGTYIDYYTQNTVQDFEIYDFIICNTKRHYSVFSHYSQSYYIPWGTDIDLYKYQETAHDRIRFFHSAGMSNRKGTEILIDAFVNGKIYEKAELIIHTQLPLETLFARKFENTSKYNIKVIEKTVSAPGLYHLGDIYVYPTTLDGLGLTMYEALSCGLPVITTDCAPMNEVINADVGKLVSVDTYKCSWDAFYWRLAYVNEKSLIEAMEYYVDNKEKLLKYRELARKTAVEMWDWSKRIEDVSNAFVNSRVKDREVQDLKSQLSKQSKKQLKQLGKALLPFTPRFMQSIIFKNR